MKRIPSVLTIASVIVAVTLIGYTAYYFISQAYHAPSHQWQPHEILALAIFGGLWLAGSSIGSGLEKMAKSIDNHASAVREAYRAFEHVMKWK